MIVRKMLSSMLAITVLLGVVSLCPAENEPKPLVTVSFAGYDRLVADIDMIGQLGGNPNLGKQLEMLALMLPQGEESEAPLALDAKTPWGAVRRKQWFRDESLTRLFPSRTSSRCWNWPSRSWAAKSRRKNGVYRIPATPKVLYAVHKNSWALLADSPKQLTKIRRRSDAAARRPAQAVRPGDPRLGSRIFPRSSASSCWPSFARQRGRHAADIQRERGRICRAPQHGQTGGPTVDHPDHRTGRRCCWAGTSTPRRRPLISTWNLRPKAARSLPTSSRRSSPARRTSPGSCCPMRPSRPVPSARWTTPKWPRSRATWPPSASRPRRSLKNLGLTEDQIKLASQSIDDLIDIFQKTLDTKKTDAATVASCSIPRRSPSLAGSTIADGAKLEKTAPATGR